MCYRISDMGLCRVEKGHTYTLDEFRNAQFEQLEEVCINTTIFLLVSLCNVNDVHVLTCVLQLRVLNCLLSHPHKIMSISGQF